jgi:hypothetical protein
VGRRVRMVCWMYAGGIDYVAAAFRRAGFSRVDNRMRQPEGRRYRSKSQIARVTYKKDPLVYFALVLPPADREFEIDSTGCRISRGIR